MSSGSETADAPEARGIVLTHGSMCFGMVDAVRKIAGAPGEALTAVSNDDRGPDDLARVLREISGGHPTVIFTDLQTGSCALVARLVCRDPSGTRVVFGTNLAMLLDFVFHRHLSLDAIVERLVDSGRRSIQSLEPETVERGHPSSPRG